MSIQKSIYGECGECESTFNINYTEMLSSKEYPEYCPFCGEPIEEMSEETFDEDDMFDEDENGYLQ